MTKVIKIYSCNGCPIFCHLAEKTKTAIHPACPLPNEKDEIKNIIESFKIEEKLWRIQDKIPGVDQQNGGSTWQLKNE